MKKIYSFLLLLSIFFLSTSSVFSQVGVGKLAGKVTDAETKEPLIGANVIILNTSLGAATDVNGDYFILNITPGTYTVKISYVGYGEKEIQDVRIVAGITYELNAQLNAGIELTQIVVTDKKLFESKATNTVKVIDASQIDRIPVRGVENLVSLQAGVVVSEGSGGVGGNATINVRGGRGQEVVYVVDGVVQNSSLWNQNFSQVANSAIEQISFQVGGFEAKYGQALSGVVNVTTKSGGPNYSLYAEAITSSFTDDYGYNMYSANVGGPIFPGLTDQTFFLDVERGWFLDGNPKALSSDFPSIGESSKAYKGNSEGLWRVSGRTYHNLGNLFTLRLSANYNGRDYRTVVWGNNGYAKNNWEHNPRIKRDNYTASARLSQNIGKASYWDLTLGWRKYHQVEGDGVFFDNILAYGDTLLNPYLPTQGDDSNLNRDAAGIWAQYGKVNNYFRKMDDQALTADASFTSQISNHLIEAGGGITYSIIKYYSIAPMNMGKNARSYVSVSGDTIPAISLLDRYINQKPNYYGYDVTGSEDEYQKVSPAYKYIEPYKPISFYGYLQDRFELSDLVLNIGLRLDYVDTKVQKLKDPNLPYAGGTDPYGFDPGDFEEASPDVYLSPRIGLGFPVTESTVFHAQYGKFVQQPRLIDVYPFSNRLDQLKQTSDYTLSNGWLLSENTTQYEVGFRQILGNNAAAINITAFYKNTKGLTNDQVIDYQRTATGEILRYYTPSNADFGTVKGLAFTLNVPRINYFAFSINYTYSIAEGTGSSSGSSFVSAFRNVDNEVPKTIAPLDFDQPHTGVVNVDFYVPKGDLGFFEMTGIDLLFSFNSGRPYTPLETQNLLEGSTNWGNTKGYVNSTYGPGSFLVSLKVEKSFMVGSKTVITPYLWIDNLFNAKNAVSVWRSTGSPYTTDYLTTDNGERLSAQNGTQWVEDYQSMERDPSNFGIPRLIRLGLKMNLAGL